MPPTTKKFHSIMFAFCMCVKRGTATLAKCTHTHFKSSSICWGWLHCNRKWRKKNGVRVYDTTNLVKKVGSSSSSSSHCARKKKTHTHNLLSKNHSEARQPSHHHHHHGANYWICNYSFHSTIIRPDHLARLVSQVSLCVCVLKGAGGSHHHKHGGRMHRTHTHSLRRRRWKNC